MADIRSHPYSWCCSIHDEYPIYLQEEHKPRTKQIISHRYEPCHAKRVPLSYWTEACLEPAKPSHPINILWWPMLSVDIVACQEGGVSIKSRQPRSTQPFSPLKRWTIPDYKCPNLQLIPILNRKYNLSANNLRKRTKARWAWHSIIYFAYLAILIFLLR